MCVPSAPRQSETLGRFTRAMCMVAYIASRSPLPLIPWQQGAPAFNVTELSEHEQRVAANTVRNHGLSYSFRDLVSGGTMVLGEDLLLEPYRFLWLAVM